MTTYRRAAPDTSARTRLAAVEDWRHRATCLDENPEMFFPIGNTGPALLQIEEAKTVCRRCPVIAECRRWAEGTRQEYGIWGGLSEEERRALRRKKLAAAQREASRSESCGHPHAGTEAGWRHHRSTHTAACRACRSAAPEAESGCRAAIPERTLQEAVRRRDLGGPVNEIAGRLGVSRSTLRYALEREARRAEVAP